MAPRPPLGLSVVARDANGAETIWWSGDRYPYNRPQNLSFRTRRGEGFSDANCTLARDIRGEYVDLNLLDDVVVVGDEGSIAYEGRLQSTPRTFDSSSGHSIQPSWIGWMTHAQDRSFSEVFVDRTLERWGDAPLNEKVREALTGVDVNGTINWATDRGLVCSIPNQAFPAASQRALMVYIAPSGVTVSKLNYAGTVISLPTGWTHSFQFNDIDQVAGTGAVAVTPTLDGTLRAATPATVRGRYVGIFLLSASTALTPAAGAMVRYDQLAVYGNSGLATRNNPTAAEPDGLYLTDILRWIAQTYCPKLNTRGVLDNTTFIAQMVFDEEQPFNAFLELNKYALWELAVWENKTLTYAPADLTDYDWEVRLSDPGVSTTLQGDDASDLRNGIVVLYDDVVTGRRERLTPDDSTTLQDLSPTNPANVHGIKKWGDPFTLSSPCTADMALQFGRMKLADLNQAKESGTIGVQGHIRDRAGHWQPVWKVRAGDTVAITDFPNARPRLIVETDYQHDGRQLNVSVDDTFHTLDAFIDRVDLARRAANLA